MAFMELQTLKKGALYCAECARCGGDMYAHEWASWDYNEERDALQAGTSLCPECGGRASQETFRYCGRQYACRYSAPGYQDCTDWNYGPNRRKLEREVRKMYG